MARQISFIFLLFAGIAAAQKPNPPRDFPIDSITVEGNRILPAAGIVAASGLKVGAPGNSALFDAARDRLLATGYLEGVSYRYKPAEKGAGYEIVFDVRESQPLYTIAVEALAVTPAEAIAYLKTQDPLFTGRIPGTNQVLERCAREIEQFLERKHQPAKVVAKITAITPQHLEALFTPAEGVPHVALVTFEGSKAIRDLTLQNTIAEVAFGQPYTDSLFQLFLDNSVRPLYEKEGYMRVRFSNITTKPSADVKGLDVHVVVEDGPQFKLGTTTIRGAMDSDSKHLLRVAKVPQMGVVDFEQLRAAAIRIKDSLRHDGYLDAEVSTDRDINDEKKTVDVFFVPQPGPQYSFGKLEVKGLGLDGVAAIEKMWTVKTGDPFPGEYPDYFVKQVKEEGLFDNLGDSKAEQDANPETHIVNVTLNFKYAPEQKKKKPMPGDDQGLQSPFPQ